MFEDPKYFESLKFREFYEFFWVKSIHSQGCYFENKKFKKKIPNAEDMPLEILYRFEKSCKANTSQVAFFFSFYIFFLHRGLELPLSHKYPFH